MGRVWIVAAVLSWLLAAGVVAAQDAPAIQVRGQVPQEQHAKLREGDRVVVTGAVTNERTRVVAATVERLGP